MTVEMAVRLPPELEKVAKPLRIALSTSWDGPWPDGEDYHAAEQPAAIAERLIDRLHDHLESAKVAYLFREKMKPRFGYTRLGTAYAVKGRNRFLTGFHFVIEFNWTAWKTLTPEQKVALVDHELCHCVKDEKSDEWALMKRHDVEEFTAILRRWGPWKDDLREFVGVARQLSLFDGGVED